MVRSHFGVFMFILAMDVLKEYESESESCSVVSNSFATPWAEAFQAPLSMGFPRQGHWSGLPFPSPGDFPDPGIKPRPRAISRLSYKGSPRFYYIDS